MLLIKGLIRPIMPFDAKNRDMNKLNEISPTLFPNNRESAKLRSSLLYTLEGMTSRMKVCSCTWMLFLEMNGRLGISVNRNSREGDRHDEIVRYGGSPFREPVRFDLFIKEANYIIQRNALEPW